MRIELNSGGLSSGAAILDFQSDFSSMIDRSKKVVSSFQVVKRFTYNMNGGAGSLQDAAEQIGSRINDEQNKISALENIQRKANGFIELTHKIDAKVCDLVNRNKNEFYKVNPWSKPPQTEEKKKWYEKAGEWVCSFGKAIDEGLNKIKNAVVDFGKSVKDTISKAWDKVVSWYEENKEMLKFVLQVAVEVLVGAAVIALAAVTGGASLAITVAIFAGVSAALGGAGEAVNYYMENGTLEGASKNIIGGVSKGFMTGAISSYATGGAGKICEIKEMGRLATMGIGMIASGGSSVIGNTIHAAADFEGVSSEEGADIVQSGIIDTITGGVDAYRGFGKQSTLDFVDTWRSNDKYTKKTIESIKNNAVKNMKQGIPGSVYNAQEAIRDLSAFNIHLKKLLIKDISLDVLKYTGGNIKSEVYNKLLEPTVVY